MGGALSVDPKSEREIFNDLVEEFAKVEGKDEKEQFKVMKEKFRETTQRTPTTVSKLKKKANAHLHLKTVAMFGELLTSTRRRLRVKQERGLQAKDLASHITSSAYNQVGCPSTTTRMNHHSSLSTF